MRYFNCCFNAIGSLLACYCAVAVNAATLPSPLTEQAAVRFALTHNPSIQQANLQRISDRFALRVAHNAFHLRYGLAAEATLAAHHAATYNLQPKLQWTTPLGTQWDMLFSQQLANSSHHNWQLSLRQPLLRGAGRAMVQQSLDNAIDQEAIAKLAWKAAVMNAVNEVLFAYRKVVQDQHQLQVQRAALAQAKQSVNEYRIRVKAGGLARSTLVAQQAQVVRQQLQLADAVTALTKDKRDLLIVLGVDVTTPLLLDNKMAANIAKLPARHTSVINALAHNIAYQQAILQLAQAKRALAVASNAQHWAIDMTAGWQHSHRHQGQGGEEKQLALALDVPIHDLPRRQQLIAAQVHLAQQKIALQQQRQRVIATVDDFLERLRSQQKRLRLSKQEIALSEQTYHNAKLAHQHGYTPAFEVISRHNEWVNARLAWIGERMAQLNSLAEFQAFLGVTLAVWGITWQG